MSLHAQTQSSFCLKNCSIVTLILPCVCESFIRTAEYGFLRLRFMHVGFYLPPLSSAPWHFPNEWLILFTSESLRSVISLPASQWSELKRPSALCLTNWQLWQMVIIRLSMNHNPYFHPFHYFLFSSCSLILCYTLQLLSVLKHKLFFER